MMADLVEETRRVCLNEERFDVYIGRRGYGFDHLPQAGRFGNYAGSINAFERWARAEVVRDAAYREDVKGLAGKRLGCFCSSRKSRCHGDVLCELADELAGMSEDGATVLQGVLDRLRANT